MFVLLCGATEQARVEGGQAGWKENTPITRTYIFPALFFFKPSLYQLLLSRLAHSYTTLSSPLPFKTSHPPTLPHSHRRPKKKAVYQKIPPAPK